MSEHHAIERILGLVRRVATRIRAQRAFEALATGGTLAVMIAGLALVLVKTGWIALTTFWLACGVSLLLPVALIGWAWTRELDEVALAQKLDRAHGLHDRLSTAISLAHDSDRAQKEWADSQIEDAARHTDNLDIVQAAPYRKPIDLTPLAVAVIAFGVLIALKPPSHDHPLPEPVEIKHDPVLDSATLAFEREKLEQLKQELADIDDPEAKELLEEIEALLDAVEAQEISEKQFLEKIAELEKKIDKPDGEDANQEIAEALKKAAEELEKTAKKELAEDPDAKALVEALKKEDLAEASKALSKLAEKLMDKNMSEKDLERLAKLMEKFAKALDINDPALQKLMEKHQKTLEKLARKMDKKGGLSKKEKEQLKKAQSEIDRLKKEAEKNKKKKSKRELEELRRSSKEVADNAKKIKEKGGDKKKKANTKEKTDEDFYRNKAGRKTKEMSKKMKGQSKQQQKDAARKMAKRQLQELKESMRRSGKQTAGKDGEESEQGKKRGNQMREFLDRAKGKKGGGKDGKPQDHGGQSRNGKKRIGDAQNPSKDPKEGFGKGEGDRKLGEETKMDGKRVDKKLKGDEGDGPTRAEIIKSASEEGFANTAYKDMYVDYESVVEEVMDKENIPPGYRYYIKRYFQMIQPKDE